MICKAFTLLSRSVLVELVTRGSVECWELGVFIESFCSTRHFPVLGGDLAWPSVPEFKYYRTEYCSTIVRVWRNLRPSKGYEELRVQTTQYGVLRVPGSYKYWRPWRHQSTDCSTVLLQATLKLQPHATLAAFLDKPSLHSTALTVRCLKVGYLVQEQPPASH